MKQERLLGFEEVGQPGLESFPRRYYPDRVRGYLLSSTPWSTPVSIHTIETFPVDAMQIEQINRHFPESAKVAVQLAAV
jgi:hypothetical protein